MDNGLQLNFDAPDTLTINQENEAFVGTLFADTAFAIEMKPLTRSQVAAIEAKHTKRRRGVERTDQTAAAAEILSKSILGWSGINDKNGEPRPCDPANKKALLENNVSFANLLRAAMVHEETGILADDDDEDDDFEEAAAGNSESDGSGS